MTAKSFLENKKMPRAFSSFRHLRHGLYDSTIVYGLQPFFTEISQNCDDIYYTNTDLHIIQELENKDIDLIMRSLSGLN